MTLAESAIEYAAAGWQVFPLKPDKTPIVSQYQASSDEKVVYGWWDSWPDALIGHRVADGIVLMDIDPRHGGKEVWNELRDTYGNVKTRFHFSGRNDGGGHVWWRYALEEGERFATGMLDAWAEAQGLGHDAGGRWTAGIDLLQHNHRYTILPPSPHPETGEPYRWGSTVHEPIAELPGWLRAYIVAEAPVVAPKPAVGALGPLLTPAMGDGPISAYNRILGFRVLMRHGWSLISGDGESDGSLYRHPRATAPHSASISGGRLYVHSPNTPFVPTAPGEPHGYDPFDCLVVLDYHGDEKAALDALRPAPADISVPVDEIGDRDPFFVDWSKFWRNDHATEEWLYDRVLARGRGHAVYASHKVGKSLIMLAIAADIATQRTDTNVIYLDYEMTEDDIRERLEDMGYGPAVDLSRLRYALLPNLPPLDTLAGGEALVRLVEAELAANPERHVAVIIDTFSRAVQGEENSNDTTRNFYLHAGIRLKRLGATWARLDHAGKDPTRGQRGGSAKGDDVDVVWKVAKSDDGLVLNLDVARMGWVPRSVAFTMREGPLRFEPVARDWPSGTKDAAALLSQLDVPVDATQSQARAALRSEGHSLANDKLRAGLDWRRFVRNERAELLDITLLTPASVTDSARNSARFGAD